MEEAIIGRELTEETISDAEEAVVRGAEPMSQNEYKIALFKGVISEELRAIKEA